MKRKIVMIGCGVVGQGFLEILVDKKELLEKKYGFKPVLAGVSDMHKGSIMVPTGIDIPAFLEHVKAGKKINEFAAPDAVTGLDSVRTIQQADADIMVEVTYTDIETGEPASTHIREALKMGMCVATTNKGPVTLNFKELSDLAEQNKAMLRYEGVVMSGTPIFDLLNYCLATNDVQEIKGILNGTTNFIITKMEKEGLGYKEGNIFFVNNASKSDFELYFGNDKSYRGKLYNAVKEGRSDVFVYYSGHGAPGLKDKKGYFVPVEADPQRSEERRVGKECRSRWSP